MGFRSRPRPAATLPEPTYGQLGAVAAAHPLAAGTAVAVFAEGGNAVDAAIAAQAVLAVAAPDACGIGGDALFLVAAPGGEVTAVNGTGAASRSPSAPPAPGAPGTTVTVPGQVAAWEELSRRWGVLRFEQLLAPAVRLAESGFRVDERLACNVTAQRPRLERGGARGWPLLAAQPGERPPQPALAATLRAIGERGAAVLHEGALATAICTAVRRGGGGLTVEDLAEHETPLLAPLFAPWAGGRVAVQPPVSQGVLLAMALQHLDRADLPADRLDHLGVEVTEAVFAHRDRVAAEGAALLGVPLAIDPDRASGRGGPRAYLHTAGVATADAGGLVVSSLASVFDDFGSGCFVPEGGFVLNNRAEGFTAPPNDAQPGKRPVHTLAPALHLTDDGVTAMATPGADGQVQTLLQVLGACRWGGATLTEAVDAPRWRSEAGQLLVERSHPGAEDLRARGHDVVVLDDGDDRFGAVVVAGTDASGPFAIADWRRGTTTAAI